MPDFIGVYPKAASDDYCDRMVAAFDYLDSTTSSCRGEDTNIGVENRKDYSFMFEIDAPDLAVETNAILDQCLRLYGEEYPSILMQEFYSRNIKVQKTPPKGGFHRWHAEHSGRANSCYRNLVWCIYLSDVPKGEGETEFLEFGRKIAPEKGTVSLFPASWTHTHRGNPVYSCNKYIATGWYYLNP